MRGHLISVFATSAQLVSPFHPSPGAAPGVSNAVPLAWVGKGDCWGSLSLPILFDRQPYKPVSVLLRVWKFRSGRL